MRSVIIVSLLILFVTAIASADRIQHFVYTACYFAVPIREKPDPLARKVGTIPKGTEVRVSEQKKHWVKVVFKDADNNYWVGWSASTALCPKTK